MEETNRENCIFQSRHPNHRMFVCVAWCGAWNWLDIFGFIVFAFYCLKFTSNTHLAHSIGSRDGTMQYNIFRKLQNLCAYWSQSWKNQRQMCTITGHCPSRLSIFTYKFVSFIHLWNTKIVWQLIQVMWSVEWNHESSRIPYYPQSFTNNFCMFPLFSKRQ